MQGLNIRGDRKRVGLGCLGLLAKENATS